MKGQRVLVCGGGEMAAAKLRLLLKSPATIEVFSAKPCESVEAWAHEGRLQLHRRRVEKADLTPGSTRLVYVALMNENEVARVLAIGREANVMMAVVDNLELSDFITPAIVDRSPVTVAIGTEGTAPVLSRRIKARVEEMLSTDLGKLASMAASFRPRVKALPGMKQRRMLWESLFDSLRFDALGSGWERSARQKLNNLLQAAISGDTSKEGVEEGHVDLVGAGPGDPELLTLRARRLLNSAEVIVHDRLVSNEVLDLARREARFIDVGKAPGQKGWKQEAISELLIKLAQKGEKVVRLKSGDPGMFGRLDEEISSLRAAQISFDIVPGITAAVAAASAASVSMTRRDRNSSVRFLTGHDINGFAEHEWKSLAEPGAVAAVYMGLAAIPFLQSRLLIHGASADTPVCIVENVSRASQVILSTTLHELPDSVTSASLTGPAVILLGLQSAIDAVDTSDSTVPLPLQAIA